MLWVGSGLLGVLLFAVMLWSWSVFKGLMGDARVHVEQAESQAAEPVAAFKHVNVLASDADRLDNNPWASRMLSLGFGASEPIRGIRTVQVGLFHRGVLQAALKDVETALASGAALKAKDPPAPADPFEKGTKAQAYEAALRQYIAWYAMGSPPAAGIKSDDLRSQMEAMCGIIPEDSKSITQRAWATSRRTGRCSPR